MCHFDYLTGLARAPRFSAVLTNAIRELALKSAIAACLLGCGRSGEKTVLQSIPLEKPTIQIADSGLPTITMSESEFDDWLQARRQASENHPRLKQEVFMSRLPERVGHRYPYVPALNILLPDREEPIVGRSITIDLESPDLDRLVSELRVFPETIQLLNDWTRAGNPEYDPQEFEEWNVPFRAIEGVLQLPLVRTVQYDGGIFDRQAMRLIASHPGLTELHLGRCVIRDNVFAEIENLISLEKLRVTTGASPEWFKTLAKLPNFRVFSICGKTLGEVDLYQPIDDETREAIESLDGRLEEFEALGTYGLVVHTDIVKALLRVKSLKKLNLAGGGPSLAFEDFEELANMPNLIELHFYVSTAGLGDKEAQARAIMQQAAKDAQERRRAAKANVVQEP